VGGEGDLGRDAIVLSVSDAIGLGGAPVPANESERLLYRQVYETLVDVDCTGTLHGGLAGDWRRLQGGRVWEFTLRPGARFSDGSTVSSRDVKESWVAAARTSGPGLAPLWAWLRPDSVRITGETRLAVTLDGPREDPVLFAHPALAVAKPSPDGAAPLGTGPYVLAAAAKDTILCRPSLFNPAPGFAVLRVVIVPGADPRDLIGGGGDAVLVREREALSYAASVPDMQVIPLSWDRMYLLVSSHMEAGKPEWRWRSELHDLRGELASDIAASEAREAAVFAFDTGRRGGCNFRPGEGARAAASPDSQTVSNVVYRSGDPDAERLASRMVALEDPEDTTAAGLPGVKANALPVGVELPGDRFLASLARGGEWMYVVGLRQSFPDPCLDLELLLDRVPWIRCRAGDCTGEAVPLGAEALERAAIPLIMTRPSLVCRRTLAGIELGWDGIPRFRGAGWTGTPRVP
jgi:hypothetical protein